LRAIYHMKDLKMNKLLQKIEWKTRRLNLKFSLLDLYLHDGDGCWGFSFCEVVKDYHTYSLLSIEFRLPNGAERRVVQLTNWDLFYISTPLWRWVDRIEDSAMYGHTPGGLTGICYKLASKLYK